MTKLSTNLRYLFLWENQITGQIPTRIGDLANLHSCQFRSVLPGIGLFMVNWQQKNSLIDEGIRGHPFKVYQRRRTRVTFQHSLGLDDVDWSLIQVFEEDIPLDLHVTSDQWLDLTWSCLSTFKDHIRKNQEELTIGSVVWDAGLKTEDGQKADTRAHQAQAMAKKVEWPYHHALDAIQPL